MSEAGDGAAGGAAATTVRLVSTTAGAGAEGLEGASRENIFLSCRR